MSTRKKTDTALYVFTVILFCLFVVSFAIAVPILFRPFYYWNIKWLGLEEATGFSYQTIVGAFNEVMDYLVLYRPFGTGDLAYSPEGMAHFADCRALFTLDLAVVAVSAVVLAVLFVKRKTFFRRFESFRFSPSFASAAVLAVVFGILGVWGAADFDSLFTAFHKAFFPGKDNWVFSPHKDEIIKILPQEFWVNCVILIGCIIFAFLAVFVLREVARTKNKKRRERQ